MVPLELTRDLQGFSFGTRGWHPLVAAITDDRREGTTASDETTLQRYFSSFRPASALEAIAGFEVEEACGLAALPPHLFRLVPWSPWSGRQLDQMIRAWYGRDAREHGLLGFDLDQHGVAYFGPASPQIHDLEMHRMRSIYSSILERGFDRSQGDCKVFLVRRGDDYRAVADGGGRHRIAAMAALGCEYVPAQFHGPIAVDARDVAYWPAVRAGAWSVQDARNYVDHLFEFDSLGWAEQRHLV